MPISARKRRFRDKNRRYLQTYKSLLACERCGYHRNPAALDFHHRPGQKKTAPLSQMLKDHRWETILEELAKCELLCANCHREEHHDAHL